VGLSNRGSKSEWAHGGSASWWGGWRLARRGGPRRLPLGGASGRRATTVRAPLPVGYLPTGVRFPDFFGNTRFSFWGACHFRFFFLNGARLRIFFDFSKILVQGNPKVHLLKDPGRGGTRAPWVRPSTSPAAPAAPRLHRDSRQRVVDVRRAPACPHAAACAPSVIGRPQSGARRQAAGCSLLGPGDNAAVFPRPGQTGPLPRRKAPGIPSKIQLGLNLHPKTRHDYRSKTNNRTRSYL
jgi:hypothetical protein